MHREEASVSFAQQRAAADAELDVDVAALADGLSREGLELAVVSTPSILRRLAARIAPRVEPGTDRVCASGVSDAALAIAVSLHTGVAAAIFDDEGAALSEIHAGERVVVVSVRGGARASELVAALGAEGHEQVELVVALEADGQAAEHAQGQTAGQA